MARTKPIERSVLPPSFDRLLWRLHDARVDHLAASCDIAMPGQLTVDRVKHGLAGASLDQAFLEVPDGGAIGELAAVAQADKALEAQTIEQLEFHLLVTQVEQLLDQQHARHQFSAEWRTAAALTAGAWCGMVNRGGQRREVDMLLQHPQVGISSPTSCQNCGWFFEVLS